MSTHCGSSTGYRHHVRDRTPKCDPCRNARRIAQAAYRKRVYLARSTMTLDPRGTRRRIQALARIGWNFAEIGKRMGVTAAAVGHMTERDTVYLANARKVAAVYDELCMTPGPSDRTRRRAEAKGWPAPLSWDDIDTDELSWEDVERAHEEALWEHVKWRKARSKVAARARAKKSAERRRAAA